MSNDLDVDIAGLAGLEVSVMRIPVVSAGHLSKHSRALLQSGQAPWLSHLAPYTFGWFVAVPDSAAAAAPTELPIPGDLQALFAWATSHGFGWIRLDADGDLVAGLPVFV